MAGASHTGSGRDARRAAVRRRHRRDRQAHGAVSVAGDVKSEINVTPFVDVVLVLLIIFMMVTPMLQRGVDVALPLTDNHAEEKDTGEQLFISVRRDGSVFLGQERVAVERLADRLRPLLSRQPAPPVFIKGDRSLTFAPVRKVLEAVHAAGAPGVSLATQARKEGT